MRGAAVLTGLYAAGSARAATTTTTGVVFALKPGAQCNCNACHAHATNKLFATRAAATHDRAHPGCKCTVVRTQIEETTWLALFGSGAKPARTAVDRRWASTKRALKRAAATASRTPTTPSTKTTHTGKATHKPGKKTTHKPGKKKTSHKPARQHGHTTATHKQHTHTG